MSGVWPEPERNAVAGPIQRVAPAWDHLDPLADIRDDGDVSEESDSKVGSAWAAAEAAGMDMSLIEANLELSYMERCRQYDRAVTAAMELRQAALNQIDGLSRAIETSR